MRAIGLSAAALAVALAIGFAVRAAGYGDALAHTCSATDKRFIQTARTDLTALSVWLESYRSGNVAAQAVAAQTRDAAERVRHVEPHDRTLREVQRLLGAMFAAYGEAVLVAAKERDDVSRHMQRAHALESRARAVLNEAGPELAERGCDVAALL